MKRRNVFKLALGAIAGAFTGFTGEPENVEASPTTTDEQNWIEVDDGLPIRKDHNFNIVPPYQVNGVMLMINPDWVNAPYEEKVWYHVSGIGTKRHLWTRKP